MGQAGGDGALRIAIWSGPRNISTAMMRSWGARADTAVCDEPFYAHYLLKTGAPHPGRDEVLADQASDWRKVAAWITGPVPGGKAIFYQKQMAHHLLPDMGRDWLDKLTHGFLLRDPMDMLRSLDQKLETIALADTGLPQQWEVFQYVRQRTGETPPVISAEELLADPEAMLRALCEALGAPFDPAMLSWPPGRRETDGVWAKYWYHSVEASTGFRPFKMKTDPLPAVLQPIYEACLEPYEALRRERIRL